MTVERASGRVLLLGFLFFCLLFMILLLVHLVVVAYMLALPGAGVRQSVSGKGSFGNAWSRRSRRTRWKGETRPTREQARMKPVEECEVPPAQQIVPVHPGLGIAASSNPCGHCLRIRRETREQWF